jgi:DNA-directed RNA polymerase beta' subunit
VCTGEIVPANLVTCQEKLVQEAVDTLFDSGSRAQPTRDGHSKVYKSLSDVNEGKEKRFRETLLGKRIDYSRRSDYSRLVGPSLSLHQYRLPLNTLFFCYVSAEFRTQLDPYTGDPTAPSTYHIRRTHISAIG